VGRRPLLAAATIGLLGLTLPIRLLVRRGGPVGLPLGYLVLGAALGCFVLPSFLSELFPTRVRSSGLAITYGLGSALFGGTAPSVDTLLVQRTGNPLLPTYYATTVALLAAIGVLPIGETAFQPLDADETRAAERRDGRLESAERESTLESGRFRSTWPDRSAAPHGLNRSRRSCRFPLSVLGSPVNGVFR
jgi:hypothetical protein